MKKLLKKHRKINQIGLIVSISVGTALIGKVIYDNNKEKNHKKSYQEKLKDATDSVTKLHHTSYSNQTKDIAPTLVGETRRTDKEKLMFLNEASYEELKEIPRVGNLIAQRIVRERPFETIEHVKSIRRIPYTVFENI